MRSDKECCFRVQIVVRLTQKLFYSSYMLKAQLRDINPPPAVVDDPNKPYLWKNEIVTRGEYKLLFYCVA